MPLPIKPLLLVAALGLALASTACATPSVEKTELVGRVHVTYYDLDPQKEADARVLLGRLERAAYKACGGNPRGHRSYEIMPRYTVEVFEECRENAISCAVDSVHSVTLERLLASRRGADRPAPAKECRTAGYTREVGIFDHADVG
jgi:UrcA family protein